MNDFTIESPFRLSKGGLFYWLLLKLRLVKENRYDHWRCIVLFSGLTWLPLFVMAAIDDKLVDSTAGIIILVAPFIPLIFTQISIKEALQRLPQTFV